MSIVLITGSGGLIGSEATKFFIEKGFDVIGIDNDMRSALFGVGASVNKKIANLKKNKRYTHIDADIRNRAALNKIIRDNACNLSAVIHTAAQPSHDLAASIPFADFEINAIGTMNVLEPVRNYCNGKVPVVFTSTNKVYGDTPNQLRLVEDETRYKCPDLPDGIDESMQVDHCTHSLFGVSKASADLMVQEYGRYFDMPTVCFRGGCLTGPAHSGAELHGFLSYLIKCAVNGNSYTVFGYNGKQVRDNIHSYDLVNAFWHFIQKPSAGAVYNIGGGTHSNISMLEAIDKIQRVSGRVINYTMSDKARIGDHKWYVSNVNKFKNDYPEWSYTYDMERIIKEMVEVELA